MRLLLELIRKLLTGVKLGPASMVEEQYSGWLESINEMGIVRRCNKRNSSMLYDMSPKIALDNLGRQRVKISAELVNKPDWFVPKRQVRKFSTIPLTSAQELVRLKIYKGFRKPNLVQCSERALHTPSFAKVLN